MAILTKVGIPAIITTGNISAAYSLPIVFPSNTAFGAGANNILTSTGSNNSAFGVNANYGNTTGSNNSAFGVRANISNTTGSNNSAFGVHTNFSNTTGTNNSAFGVNANPSNTTGSNNSAFGVNANYGNTTGSNNSALGFNANYGNTTGSNNSVIGVNANSNSGVSKTGNNNIILGANNNDANFTSGANNTFIGTSLTGYGNVNNTVIISDGSNIQNIIADTSNVRTNRPIRPAGYTVSTLPSASTSGLGAICYASNGRKAAETTGNGTGIPVWSDGTNWLTFYDNTTVQA